MEHETPFSHRAEGRARVAGAIAFSLAAACSSTAAGPQPERDGAAAPATAPADAGAPRDLLGVSDFVATGETFRVFDGHRRLLVLDGDSIMVECRKILTRKLTRFVSQRDGGAGTLVFDEKKLPEPERSSTPIVYIAQTRLGYGGVNGIQGPDDRAKITMFADALVA